MLQSDEAEDEEAGEPWTAFQETWILEQQTVNIYFKSETSYENVGSYFVFYPRYK